MRSVNRPAIGVTPDYVDWAADIDGEASSYTDSLRGKTAVYFVEAAESPEEETLILKTHHSAVVRFRDRLQRPLRIG